MVDGHIDHHMDIFFGMGPWPWPWPYERAVTWDILGDYRHIVQGWLDFKILSSTTRRFRDNNRLESQLDLQTEEPPPEMQDTSLMQLWHVIQTVHTVR